MSEFHDTNPLVSEIGEALRVGGLTHGAATRAARAIFALVQTAKRPKIISRSEDDRNREWHRLADGLERRADTETDAEIRRQLLHFADTLRSYATRRVYRKANR